MLLFSSPMKVMANGLHERLSEREVDECRGDVQVVPLGVARDSHVRGEKEDLGIDGREVL